MKPPIRLAALMEIPVIYVFTHDSIGVGEDGPTHQPVEQLWRCAAFRASLRFVPPMPTRWSKPGGWSSGSPTSRPALALSRQPLPTFDRARYAAASGVARGAYILADPRDGKPAVILIGTGSEVALCLDGL